METSARQKNIQDELIAVINPLLAPLGYEAVYVEVQTHRQKILRVFIDFSEKQDRGIGIEDCVAATRALDEPLDQSLVVQGVFPESYELEVSSPGVDRPLRQAKDYERFKGKDVRVHVFRPLSAEELGNGDYQTRNPKQKNFLGTLLGVKNDKVHLAVPKGSTKPSKPGAKGKAKAAPDTNSADEVFIPLPLISKANLEPKFEEFAERE